MEWYEMVWYACAINSQTKLVSANLDTTPMNRLCLVQSLPYPFEQDGFN